MLASEYSWSKRDILDDVYLDELFYLTKRISDRQVRDWKMQLAIVQNPYTKRPQELWKIIDSQQDNGEEETNGGIETLKRLLGKNPRFVVK